MLSPELVAALIVLGRIGLGANFAYWGILNIGHIPSLDPMIAAKGFPQPWFLLRLAVAVEIVAGVMVAISLWPALAALALVGFTVVVTPVFHPFWQFTGEERKAQFGNVVTNACIVGGLLLVIATG